MAWVRLDDQFPDHPKVAGLSNDALCLHITAMCWTAKQQTDGKLPSRLLSRLAWRCQDPAMASHELVEAGVWEVDDVDGWNIHDYGEYNPTKANAEEISAKRSEAGKIGAAARWQNSKTDSKPIANAKQNAKQNPSKSLPPTPSPSPSERDEGLASPPARVDSPMPENDPEFSAAISKLEQARIGSMTGTALLELSALWPDLTNGRRAWLDDAIRVAQANKAKSPVYALRVLASAIQNNERPGQVPERKPGKRGGTTSAELDAIFGVDIHGNPV
jgi:hypothetical protein